MSSRKATIVYDPYQSSAYRSTSRDSYDSGYVSAGGYGAQRQSTSGQGWSSSTRSSTERAYGEASHSRHSKSSKSSASRSQEPYYSTAGTSQGSGTFSVQRPRPRTTLLTLSQGSYYSEGSGSYGRSRQYDEVTRTKSDGKSITVINHGNSSSDPYGRR